MLSVGSVVQLCVVLPTMSVVALCVYACFFFFKQKTAYEMLRILVGSEMCIRDRCISFALSNKQYVRSTGAPAGISAPVSADACHCRLSLIHI